MYCNNAFSFAPWIDRCLRIQSARPREGERGRNKGRGGKEKKNKTATEAFPKREGGAILVYTGLYWQSIPHYFAQPNLTR